MAISDPSLLPGDDALFARLVDELVEIREREDDRLLRYLRRTLRGDAGRNGEDLLQDACLAYLRAARKEPGRFIAFTRSERRRYLWQTVKNRVRKHFRQNRRCPVLRLEHEPSAETASPSERAERTEEIARVHDAIAQLPEKDATVLIQHELEGKSYRTIAREQGRTEAAVRRQRCDSMKALRSTFYGTGTWGVEDLPPR